MHLKGHKSRLKIISDAWTERNITGSLFSDANHGNIVSCINGWNPVAHGWLYGSRIRAIPTEDGVLGGDSAHASLTRRETPHSV